MLFIPLKQKYKKLQKGKSFLKIKGNKLKLRFGQIGLKAFFSFRITSKQLITLYNVLRKKMKKKKEKILIRIFQKFQIKKKPTEIRMGKGKGPVNFWVARVLAGSTICEISTFYKKLAIKVLKQVRFRFPIKTGIIFRKI